MATRNVFLTNYSIGENPYDQVGKVCAPYGTKAVFIGGKTAMSKATPLIHEALKGTGITVTGELWYGGQACYENVDMLEANPAVKAADMIFAIGGGKALDTSKCLAGRIGKPVFTFPTIAATCAAVTSVCAMYHPDGTFRDLFWGEGPATHSFISTKIIAEAPDKYLWAGIGDTLAKGYEPEFSSRGKELNHPNALGVTLSKLCHEPLLKHGTQAIADCKANRVSEALEETILAIIVTTGIVSIHVINDYNSCVAHAVCYGFSVNHQVEENCLHGELVSYGVLVQLILDGKYDDLDKALVFYRSIGLPTSYTALGATKDDLPAVIKKATEVPDTNVAAIPIDAKVISDAIENLEDYVSKH